MQNDLALGSSLAVYVQKGTQQPYLSRGSSGVDNGKEFGFVVPQNNV